MSRLVHNRLSVPLCWRPFPLKMIAILFVLIMICAGLSPAQEDELPEGVVPPPLSILSDDESDALSAETDPKKRTKLAIELMDSRLVNSKASADKDEYQEALDELGYFRAVMNNTLRFLEKNDYKKNSLRNYKRFEMALRQYISRLELVRRALPFSHAYHVRKLIKSVRDARRKSIDSFYDDSVVPNTR